jgi:GTP diphosphokinase / guanosine-3',5'-bis(diphosphate) 3'-diphosphatase
MSVDAAIEDLVERSRAAFGDDGAGCIAAAAELARDLHAGQQRKLDGAPYIVHPLAVARNCLDWGLTDPVAVMAALLHDAIEDGPPEKHPTRRVRALDRDVATLVRALCKIRKPATGAGDMPATYQRILGAAATDLRVLLIKAMDVLDNARTFHVHGPTKARTKAQLGLVYVGVARRLGALDLADELVELILPHLLPSQTRKARAILADLQQQAQEVIAQLAPHVDGLPDHGLVSWHVEQRRLAQYVRLTGTPGEAELDEVGWPAHRLRCQVTDDEAAWRVLGHVHRRFRVMPRHVRDYLNAPRVNGFRALTTRVLWRGLPLAVLVERKRDHAGNRGGILAEWGVSGPDRERYKALLATIGDTDLRMSEVHALVLQDRIDVFTPQGDRKTLPAGALAVDFAYLIHSEVGNHCIGARINGVLHSPATELADGDVVEVVTRDDARPRRSWIENVRTTRARTQVRKALRKGGGPVRGVRRDRGCGGGFVLEDPTVEVIVWSTCCLPTPPTPLLGRVSRGGRWVVHSQGCSHATSEVWEPGCWADLRGALLLRMVLQMRHRPGALSEVIDVTTRAGVNIVRLEGRARTRGPFLLDLDIGLRRPDVLGRVLAEIAGLDVVRTLREYSWLIRDTEG